MHPPSRIIITLSTNYAAVVDQNAIANIAVAIYEYIATLGCSVVKKLTVENVNFGRSLELL